MAESESIEKLYRLTVELGTTLDLEREVEIFLNWLARELRPRFAALYVTDDPKSKLEPLGGVNLERVSLPDVPLGEDFWRVLMEANPELAEREGPRYSVPLVLEGQLLGVLVVISGLRSEEWPRERKLATAAAGYLAPILRNIWRYQSLEEQVRVRTDDLVRSERKYRHLSQRLRLLREVDRAILEGKNLDEIAELVLDRMRRLLPQVGGAVARLNADTGDGDVLAARGLEDAFVYRGLGVSLRDLPGLLENLRRGRSFLAETWTVDRTGEEWELARALAEMTPRWVLVTPIRSGDQLYGALFLVARAEEEFEEVIRDIAREFSESLAVAVREMTLREEIRSYQEALEEKVRRRTAELQKLVDLMAGREIRMAELKEVIRVLRKQLMDAGLEPAAGDPLSEPEEPGSYPSTSPGTT